MLLLVNKVKEELQSRLVGQLYRHDHFESLLLENPQVAHEVWHAETKLYMLACPLTISMLTISWP